MKKLLFENEKAELQFNEKTNAIELIWKKPQDSATYKLVFTKGVEFLKILDATSWLSDIRNQGVVGPANAQWVQKEIIPIAIEAGLKKIAVVMKPDVFQEYYVKSISKNLEEADNNLMRYFDSLDKANSWLKETTSVSN